jgi:hypothetical protein
MRALILAAVVAAAIAVPTAANASTGWTRDAFRNSTSTSTNWSGYAAVGAAGAFSSVSASWTQPVATCGAGQTAASFWVGLDGDGSHSVEQIGAYSNCTADNVPQYYAWYEMYPNPAYKTTLPLFAGDKMSASVSYDRAGRYNLSITNATRGWTASTAQRSSTAQRVSAEVIAEAPSNSSGIVPLTNFGTVNFTGAKVNGAILGSSAGLDWIDMVSPTGVTKASTGPLNNGSFAVTWKHS